jgi:hypothetical protein
MHRGSCDTKLHSSYCSDQNTRTVQGMSQRNMLTGPSVDRADRTTTVHYVYVLIPIDFRMHRWIRWASGLL